MESGTERGSLRFSIFGTALLLIKKIASIANTTNLPTDARLRSDKADVTKKEKRTPKLYFKIYYLTPFPNFVAAHNFFFVTSVATPECFIVEKCFASSIFIKAKSRQLIQLLEFYDDVKKNGCFISRESTPDLAHLAVEII